MADSDVTTDCHGDGEPRAAHDERVDDTAAVQHVVQAEVVATAVTINDIHLRL